MVRRDWCPFSKRIGEQIIDTILSAASRDDVVDSIHNLLTDVGQKMVAHQIDLSEFVITKVYHGVGFRISPFDHGPCRACLKIRPNILMPHLCLMLL
jgi:hypothetical protein